MRRFERLTPLALGALALACLALAGVAVGRGPQTHSVAVGSSHQPVKVAFIGDQGLTANSEAVLGDDGFGVIAVGQPCPDADADGVPDGSDNCPAWPNPGQALPPWPVPLDDPDCDGFSSAVESYMGTLPLVACPATGTADGVDNDGDTAVDETGEGANDEEPDAWPPDADDNQRVNIGDVIKLFSGTILNPPAYVRRSDFDASGDIDIGDVIIGFGATMFLSCQASG